MTVNLEEWQSCGYKKATCIGVPFWCFFQHQVCNLKSRNAIYCHTFTTGRCFQSKWSLLNGEILKKIPKTNIIFSLWIISSSVSKKSSPDISKEKVRIIDYHLWLVVYLPLWKKFEFVSWDIYSQNMKQYYKIFQTTNQIVTTYSYILLKPKSEPSYVRQLSYRKRGPYLQTYPCWLSPAVKGWWWSIIPDNVAQL
jgi:hypothetical protein